ncbi:MAG: lysine-sensitive aspartokinase 3, partial [Acidobacteriota bacterium]
DSTLVSHIRAVGSELGRITSGIWGRAEADHDRIDDCLSWGEYLSCNILAAYLRSRGLDGEWVDARKVFVTDSRFGRARPLVGESKERARDIVLPFLAAGKVPVMQGFIGADAKGQTTTFGRGGSDYSATLVGAFLSAERVEIWTDVDGVMTANPSMVKDVRRLRRLTFDEAAELA